ncbi:hypothetical protein FRB95_013418, partial [Tulasnella sp. JGI-2019a]
MHLRIRCSRYSRIIDISPLTEMTTQSASSWYSLDPLVFHRWLVRPTILMCCWFFICVYCCYIVPASDHKIFHPPPFAVPPAKRRSFKSQPIDTGSQSPRGPSMNLNAGKRKRDQDESFLLQLAKFRSSSDGLQVSPTGQPDTEIKTMNAFLDLFVPQIRTRQTTKAQDHNTDLPISQLPDDVLSEIFQETLEVWEIYYIRLFRFSLVCSRWAAIIRDTPSLWPFICASYPLHISLIVLKRSSKHPLDVWLDDDYRMRGDREIITEAKVRAWIDMVGEHAYRWQRVKININNGSHREFVLESLERLSAPILETLEIDNSLHWGPEPKYALFGGGAQQLRSLSLSQVYVTWDSILLSELSGLQTLKFDGSVPSPSVPQIQRLLMACPNICKFDLGFGGRGEKEGENPQVLEPTTIELSSCTCFHLQIDIDATQFILEHVHAPACTDFSLVTCDSPNLMAAKTPLVMSTLNAALGHNSSRWIEISESTLQFHSQGASSFEIWLSQAISPSSSLEWLLDHCPQQSRNVPTKLNIAAYDDDPFPRIRHTLDMLSSSTTELQLSTGASPSRVIQFLADPHQVDGTLQWPLPNLESLSLRDCA